MDTNIKREGIQKQAPESALLDRLKLIASLLANISSAARVSTDPASIVEQLERVFDLIESTWKNVEPPIAVELEQINRILGMWKKSWPRAQRIPQQRTLLAVQARNWSDTILNLLHKKNAVVPSKTRTI
jgi:hypothetical protein